MAPEPSPRRRHQRHIVLTGVGTVRVAPGAPLEHARWAGKPARLGRMDRFSALALCAVDEALLDAGLTPQDAAQWDGDRTAVALGTQFGCHAINEEYYRGLLAHGPSGASPRAFAYTLPSSPVGEISIHYGARGPASTLASGGAAGLEALDAACHDLAFGRADRALVVACDSVTPLLERLLAGSLPAGDALADVAAAWVLERADDAARRGAVPRASIVARASRFVSGWRATAVGHAAQAAIDAAERPEIIAVWGAPADSDAVHAVGVGGATHAAAPQLLAPAPLFAAAEALRGDAAAPGHWLLLAGDAEGAGAAALLSVGL